jgi:cyclase
MDTDGTKAGFDIQITEIISKMLNVPVIASGGAGKMEHFKEVFEHSADAALAASIFHFREIEIMDLKKYLQQNNISVRI